MADSVVRHPLVLSVKRSTWRMHDEAREAADAAYARVRMDALKRDGWACRYCHFAVQNDPQAHPGSLAASGYLEVHHLDDDHRNNRLSNLWTVCPFCHQVHHVGNAGHRSAATLAWCPWFTQEEVNLLSNVAAVAIARKGRYTQAGHAWFRFLDQMQGRAAEVYGDAIADAQNLGSALMLAAGERSPAWPERARVLRPLRLVPRPEVYTKAIAWWSEHAWRPEAQWDAVWTEWAAASGGAAG